MTTVASVFDNEVDLEAAITLLESMDVEAENIHLLRNGEEAGEPAAESEPRAADGPVVASTGGGAVLTGVFIEPDSLGELDLSDEEQQFYVRTSEGHGNVLFVKTDDDHAQSIASAMEKSKASRVDVLG